MKSSVVTACLLAFYPLVTAAPSANACTAETRVGILDAITAAFNNKDPIASAAGIEATPTKPDTTLFFYINGSPGVQVANSGQQFKAVAISARQAVTNVDSKNSDFGNGTALMNAEVTLGAGYVIDSPVNTHINVPIQFDYADCRIKSFSAYFTLPDKIAGKPFNPPFLPPLPLGRIPPSS